MSCDPTKGPHGSNVSVYYVSRFYGPEAANKRAKREEQAIRLGFFLGVAFGKHFGTFWDTPNENKLLTSKSKT